ncbi:MAG: hypothetical protein KDA22_09360 [Phycisphaerales bacterium]|nr:hypothetical protein [Phycisphaerales bacterium]
MNATEVVRGLLPVAVVVCSVWTSVASGGPPDPSAKLLAADGAADDRFGGAVATSGNVAIVGAERADALSTDSGCAYAYRWNGSAWTEEQKLVPADGHAGDFFGFAVAVSGDVAVIGVPYDNDNGPFSGSVYVFRWNGAAWIEEQKLRSEPSAMDDRFGYSVGVSGDVLVAGAIYGEDSGIESGCAYVFRWNGSAWIEEQKLVPADAADGAWFGVSAAASGDVVAVGAIYDDQQGTNAGATFVYRWNGSAWVEEQKLAPADLSYGDQFGVAVALDGDVAVVGSWMDDDQGTNAGAAYAFRWDGSTWVLEQKLEAADGTTDDIFGHAVGVSGDVAVIGAFYCDVHGENSGAAYVYRWNGAAWVQEEKLAPSDGAAFDHFGWAVAASSERVLVGAWRDDDIGLESGSAYVYSPAAPILGDLNGDGLVNGADLGILLGAWGTPGPGDLNGDGIVDGADLGVLLANWTP